MQAGLPGTDPARLDRPAEHETLRAGLKQVAAIAPQASATAELYGVISQLREEVPVLAPVLTDGRLAAAQLDKNAPTALNSEIARLREHHFQGFDSFFAAHPEAEHLVSFIQSYHDADADLTLTPPD